MPDYIDKIRTTTGDKQINYEALANIPKINNVNLVGAKTLEELGIQPKIADSAEDKVELEKEVVAPKVVAEQEIKAPTIVAEEAVQAPSVSATTVQATTVQAENLYNKDEINDLTFMDNSFTADGDSYAGRASDGGISIYKAEGASYEQETTTGTQLFDVNSMEQVTVPSGAKWGYEINIPAGNYIVSTTNPNNVSGTGIYLYIQILGKDGEWSSITYAIGNQSPIKNIPITLEEGDVIYFYNGQGGGTKEDSLIKFQQMDYMLNIGSSALPYEPYTGGAPSPNPDYAQEPKFTKITELHSSGKNLFDADSIIKVVNNYVFDISKLVIGETYTISCDADSFSFKISNTISGNTSLGANNVTTGKSTFTMARHANIPEGATQYLFITKSSVVTANDITTADEAKALHIQIEKGSEATEYEPYKGSNNVTLDNPLVLRALPNEIADTYGNGVITRRVGVVEFDGSADEAWTKNTSSDYAYQITLKGMKPANSSNGDDLLCDSFIATTNLTSLTDGRFRRGGAEGLPVLVFRYDGLTTDDLNAWKTYLHSNPITVYYELDTPVTETFKAPYVDSFAPYTNAWYSGELNPTSVSWEVLTQAKGNDSKIADLENEIANLKSLLGIVEDDIYGLQADFTNKVFTRIGKAEGLNAGSDFDKLSMFGGRRRCNVADDGTINAFYGDAGYTEDGSNGQVMVYQPKFYYKIVPLEHEPIEGGVGYHLRKANYYVSENPLIGFKLHPAFIDKNGVECNYILLGAYEGCLYDNSATAYLTADEQVMDAAADKLSSIANVKPASGLTQQLTRPNLETMAQNRGDNWHLMNVQAISANQMLMAIELGGFNFQTLLGAGVTSITDDSSLNCSSLTGSTSALGNKTGVASQTINTKGESQTIETASNRLSVSYRGMENPYGNIWDFIYGVNIYSDTSTGEYQAYICNDLTPVESKKDDNYEPAGFTLAKANGYASAFGYSEKFDWLFMASETKGDSNLPIGDYHYQNTSATGYRVALLGSCWNYGSFAGGFYWYVRNGVGYRYRSIGGRLVYIPTKNYE